MTVKVAIEGNLKECGFSQGLLYSRYNSGTEKSDCENHKKIAVRIISGTSPKSRRANH